MSTVTILAEDYFVESLHAYALSVGKGVSQAVRDLLTLLIPVHGMVEQGAVGNPWKEFCGCVPKDEAVALRAFVNEQDVVDEGA